MFIPATLTLSIAALKTISLLCDGAISNMSESIMKSFGVGQDEFIFRMYSIALIAITAAAVAKGDMRDGLIFILQPGTYAEQQSNVPLEERSWSSSAKITVMIVSGESMKYPRSHCPSLMVFVSFSAQWAFSGHPARLQSQRILGRLRCQSRLRHERRQLCFFHSFYLTMSAHWSTSSESLSSFLRSQQSPFAERTNDGAVSVVELYIKTGDGLQIWNRETSLHLWHLLIAWICRLLH